VEPVGGEVQEVARRHDHFVGLHIGKLWPPRYTWQYEWQKYTAIGGSGIRIVSGGDIFFAMMRSLRNDATLARSFQGRGWSSPYCWGLHLPFMVGVGVVHTVGGFTYLSWSGLE
jgi:hypothetical protein